MNIRYGEVEVPDTSVPLADIDEGAIVVIDRELFIRGRAEFTSARAVCYPLSGGKKIAIEHTVRCVQVELCEDQLILYRRKNRE